MESVRRLVRRYEPGGELIGEAALDGVPLSALQAIFRGPPSDPMYDCWRIRAERLPALAPYLTAPVVLDRFSYYVEADAAT